MWLTKTSAIHYNARSSAMKTVVKACSSINDILGFECLQADQSGCAAAYAPILAAELMHFEDSAAIEAAIVATVLLDLAARAVDAVADDPFTDRAKACHESHLLMARAVAEIAPLVKGDAQFWYEWQSCIAGAIKAERSLQSRPPSITFDATASSGKNACMLVPALIFASMAGDWYRVDSVVTVLRELAAGIQCIDDLMDWEEDQAVGLSTHVVCLIESGQSEEAVAQTALSQASQYVTSAANHAHMAHSISAAEQLHALSREIRVVSEGLPSAIKYPGLRLHLQRTLPTELNYGP